MQHVWKLNLYPACWIWIVSKPNLIIVYVWPLGLVSHFIPAVCSHQWATKALSLQIYSSHSNPPKKICGLDLHEKPNLWAIFKVALCQYMLIILQIFSMFPVVSAMEGWGECLQSSVKVFTHLTWKNKMAFHTCFYLEIWKYYSFLIIII